MEPTDLESRLSRLTTAWSLEQELIDLRLQSYCHSALERRRQG